MYDARGLGAKLKPPTGTPKPTTATGYPKNDVYEGKAVERSINRSQCEPAPMPAPNPFESW
jgi:hypothetical protein